MLNFYFYNNPLSLPISELYSSILYYSRDYILSRILNENKEKIDYIDSFKSQWSSIVTYIRTYIHYIEYIRNYTIRQCTLVILNDMSTFYARKVILCMHIKLRTRDLVTRFATMNNVPALILTKKNKRKCRYEISVERISPFIMNSSW